MPGCYGAIGEWRRLGAEISRRNNWKLKLTQR